jgi:hypothetical protein
MAAGERTVGCWLRIAENLWVDLVCQAQLETGQQAQVGMSRSVVVCPEQIVQAGWRGFAGSYRLGVKCWKMVFGWQAFGVENHVAFAR